MTLAGHPTQQSALAWRWALTTLVYDVTICLAHLQFSLWLVRKRETFLGRMALADLVPGLAVAAGLALLAWIAWQLRRSALPRLTAAMWLLWLVSVVLIDRFLTFSANEYAHYPQYALLAWLLARTLDPDRTRWLVGRVLFWATLLGMGDELLQYLWITTSYSDYLDFNDFLTNLVAAAAGMLLYYGTAPLPTGLPERNPPVLTWMLAAILTLALVAALLIGRVAVTPTETVPPGGMATAADGSRRLYLQRDPGFYGSQQKGPRHGQYHVLAPLPALTIMLTLGLLFGGYGRFTPAIQPNGGGQI